MLKSTYRAYSSNGRRISTKNGLVVVLCLAAVLSSAQDRMGFFVPADSLHKGRFWAASGITAAGYTGTVIGLNEIWYKQYPRSSFQFKNDWGEWENMDKAGHLFTTYMYSRLISDVTHWTGIRRPSADWAGVGTALLFQTTVEIMDGFSEQWGFSWSDMAFNVFGAGAYIGQQALWGEQRITFKFSSSPIDHPDYPVLSEDGESIMALDQRAENLFGTGFFEQLLKDYNAQTIWASVNVHSFLNPESQFPRWLNVAAGYSGNNMYGGYTNEWNSDGATFVLSDTDFPRYRQYFISLDVDFTRIPVRSPFVKTLFGLLNIIKIPAPAIEFNKVRGVKLHALKF